MNSFLKIRPLKRSDISRVTTWARLEGFAPGVGDLSIYRHTDRQGLWVGWLGNEPIGCIAGVSYNSDYGFIGLFLVVPEHRGHGYGIELWKHAIDHLSDLRCIGLEAAPEELPPQSEDDLHRPALQHGQGVHLPRQVPGQPGHLLEVHRAGG